MASLVKEECITILKNIYNGDTISSLSLIQIYCIEKDKNPNLINIFIQVLLTNNLLQTIIDYVIDYYETKFNIIKIYNKQNQLLKIY
jgi:hypothetical protein